jgi:hypothetical protein
LTALAVVSPTAVQGQCADSDGDGYCFEVGCSFPAACDCNDLDSRVFSGAAEACDGFDNDCNGQVDDPVEGCSGILTHVRKVGGDLPVVDHEGASKRPSLAWSRGGHLIVYADDRQNVAPFASTLFAAHLDPVGGLERDEPLFASPPSDQSRPQVAWTGRGYGVVWTDARDGVGTIYFARLDRNGEVIEELPLSDSLTAANRPRIAWSGKNFGVAWVQTDFGTGERQTRFRAVGEDGELGSIREPGIDHDEGVEDVRLEWNGTHFGLAVAYPHDPAALAAFYLVLLDEAGIQQGAARLVQDGVTDNDTDVPLGLTWSGGEWGVWWEGECGFFGCEVMLARLYPDGSFVDPVGRFVNVTQRNPNSTNLNNVAWNGQEYGLIFRDTAGSSELHFSRVSVTGEMQGQALRVSSNGSGGLDSEDLAWTGRWWSVVWTDQLGGSVDLYFTRLGNDQDADERVAGDDCDDTDGTVWGPGPARRLEAGADKQTITWLEPEDAGNNNGWSVHYDVLRSDSPGDFSDGNPQAICIETESPDTVAVDGEVPSVGSGFHYLVRTFLLVPPEGKRCGDALGRESDGVPRAGRACM